MRSNAILTATLVLLSSALVPIRADAAVCRAADSVSADQIFSLRRYAGATTGGNRVVRVSLHLPFTTSLSLITSESVCKKANAAYQAVRAGRGSGLSGRVYVVQVGTVYAVLDPEYQWGTVPGVWTVIIFDSRWRKLSTYQS